MSSGWITDKIATEVKASLWRRVFRKALLVFLLAVGVFLRMQQINFRWTTDFRGQCGSHYSNVARNFVNYGFLATKFAPVDSINPKSPDDFIYYVNHPPLLEWLVALSFKAFGMNEFTARLVPLFFSLLTMIVLFLLVRRLWNEQAALCVLAVFCILPMGVFYGTLVDVQGVLPLFFVVLVLYLYERFAARPCAAALLMLYAAFVIGMLTDWPVYYLSVLLPLYHLFLRRKHKLAVAALFPLAVAMLAAWVVYGNWIRTGRAAFDFGYLQYLVSTRATDLSGASPGVVAALLQAVLAVVAAIPRMGEIWLMFFTAPVLIMLAAWLVAVPVMRILRKGTRDYWIIWFFFVFAVLHIALFAGPAQMHEYWSFYLLPSAAIAGGLTIYWAGKLFSRMMRGGGFAVQIAIFLLLFAGAYLQFRELYRTGGEMDFAAIAGNIDKVCDGESYILTDWNGCDVMSFYLHNQIIFGPINRTNYEMVDRNPRARYILMMDNDIVLRKQRFGLDLFEYARKSGPKHYGPLTIAKMLDIKGLKRFECPDPIDAPKIENVRVEDRRVIVRWSHAPSGKVAFYRVYWRTDKMPFYSLWADVKEGGEAVVKNYSREHLWLVVVAVDKDGEESGFEKEIKGWNDGAK